MIHNWSSTCIELFFILWAQYNVWVGDAGTWVGKFGVRDQQLFPALFKATYWINISILGHQAQRDYFPGSLPTLKKQPSLIVHI